MSSDDPKPDKEAGAGLLDPTKVRSETTRCPLSSQKVDIVLFRCTFCMF